MQNGTGKRVLIIQSQIKQYRVPFFDKLHAALAADGITLRVGYSDPPHREVGKKDNCDLSPEYGVKVKGYWGLRQRVIWQPLLTEVAAADLVIVEQANKYVMNHFLLLCSTLGMKKMAFWGLGENKQAGQMAISEWYRRRTLNRTDWWFAYTAGTAEHLTQQAVPQTKITTVQNSVDTRELRKQLAAIPQETICEERQMLGIAPGAPVGIFCGMLDPVKDIPFLIESTKLVKTEVPEFHLIIAGGGADASLAQEAASASEGWIHFVGPKFGAEKALVLKMADVFTLPGRVGLAILDAFAAGLPLLTTDIPIHGPEAEYMEEGVNGVKTVHAIEAYAMAVIDVLSHPQRLKALKEGAAKSAEKYSIEEMVRNFHAGIVQCLAQA
jgi:glycosyltransferase involved in cell wall biosynthesis